MITIITSLRSFENERQRLIQRNALWSWTQLDPRPEIIVFGNDHKGTAEACLEFGLKHISDIPTTPHGTPLANKVFEIASNLAKNELIAWVSSDIIVFQSFLKTVTALQNKGPLIGTLRRYDTNFSYSLENDPEWEKRVLNEKMNFGALGAGDLFVFTRNFLKDMPPFAIGRAVVDTWMLWRGLSQKCCVDLGPSMKIIHQYHDTGNKMEYWNENDLKEFQENRRLWLESEACNFGNRITINFANYVVAKGQLKPYN